MNLELYNKLLQQFLQSRISIKCDNKVLKTGKLTLFSTKQYFIKLYIETDKKDMKILELPYPFILEITDTGCTLNYHISSMCNNLQPITNKLKKQKTQDSMRMYDNVVVITTL